MNAIILESRTIEFPFIDVPAVKVCNIGLWGLDKTFRILQKDDIHADEGKSMLILLIQLLNLSKRYCSILLKERTDFDRDFEYFPTCFQTNTPCSPLT